MRLPSFLANKGLSRLPLVERIADHFYKRDEIVTIYGQRMRLDPQDSMRLSRWGFYEKEETERIRKIIRQIVRHGDQCITVDVGANIGYYSLILADLVGDSGFVHAFEPHPENYALLLLNQSQNGFKNIVPRNVACSSLAGWMYLHLSPISSGMHTIETSMLERDTYHTTSQLEVRTVVLDNELEDWKINFMKVDVEGHELEVLKGAYCMLRAQQPILMVEYSASPKVIPYLESLDYSLEFVNEKNLFAFPNKPADNIPRSQESLAEG